MDMRNYALYKLPYADTFTEIRSERAVRVLPSYDFIGREAGFVVAPFAVGVGTDIVLIQPDEVTEHQLQSQTGATATTVRVEEQEKDAMPDDSYSKDFNTFHEAICRGQFMKLVLSRSKVIDVKAQDYRELFLETCRRYPRLMVMLVSTPKTGTWLVASPEILLRSDGSWWRTMALAGTMPYKDGYQEWSEKNRHEQHFVEAYIEDRLSDYSIEILKDGPRTQRAGDLVHLCTDFRFRLAQGCGIGEVLASLHPTPAVCGIPKALAREFILTNEKTERRYFSGFMGPVGVGGETRLYVSLRCAELHDGSATLYAGGGIMPESTMQSEWEETEHKMKTIGVPLNLDRMTE